METKPDLTAFRTLTTIVADSPEQIRACDVDRLLVSARGVFDAAEFYAFAAWLYLRAGVGIHSEIDDWLAEEDQSRIDFLEDTFSVRFYSRDAFNAMLAKVEPSPLVVDVGHADMILMFDGIETE